MVLLAASCCCLCSAAGTSPNLDDNVASARLTNLRVKRQLSEGVQSSASRDQALQDEPQQPSTSTTPVSSYVLFKRWVSVGTNPYVEITNSKRSEVVTLAVKRGGQSPVIKLKCAAEVHPHFVSNPPLPITVNWRRMRRRDNQQGLQHDQFIDLVESRENEAVLRVNDSHFEDEDFRCVAHVAVPFQQPSSQASVKTTVLSRAIKVRYLHHTNLHISPLRQIVVEGMPARLRCSFNVSAVYSVNSDSLTISVVWTRNGQIVQEETSIRQGIRIFTTTDQSILHIGSVTFTDYSAKYQCTLRVDNSSSTASSPSSTLLVVKSSSFIEQPENNNTIIPELTNNMNVMRNAEAILECLLPKTDHINWFSIVKEKGPIVTRSLLSNDSALIFDPKHFPQASVEPVEFQCAVKEKSGVIFTYKFLVSVKEDSYFDYEEDSFTQVSKHQGQIAKLICETYPQTGEEPQMATWYKDGKVFQPFPRAKLSTVYTGNIQGMSLFLSIIEPDDQGIYECIVRNGDVERIHQTSFTVIQSTNETIQDLRVAVDHLNSCFHANFRLPASVKMEEAKLTTYFLIYYKADNSTPLNFLNSVPFNTAKCSAFPANRKHIRCALSVCSNNYNFEPATEYVFRASMVLNQADMDVITPLSQPVFTLSFDGYASKGLDLNILYLKSDEQLMIRWEAVSDDQIDGTVQGYYLEIFNHSTTEFPLSSKKTSINLAEKDLSYTIEKLSSKKAFSYKFRVIPITRAGRPPNNMLDSVDRFAFTVFNSEFANAEVTNHSPEGNDPKAVDSARKNIPAPSITLKQQDRKPSIVVEWAPTDQWNKAQLMHIRYGNNLAINQNKHLTIQQNFFDGNALLATDNLELGFVYQVCASVQTTDTLTGFWHCSNIPLLDSNGKLLFYHEQDFTEAKNLPKPVLCELKNCYCHVLPRSQTIRVFWDINSTTNRQEENKLKPSKSRSKPVPSSTAFFVLHYTQNESNPTAPDFSIEFPSTVELDKKSKPRKWADVPEGNLMPDSTYRIMIEAQNADRDGVFGTYFDCHTPSDFDFPAPSVVDASAVDSGSVRVSWTPLDMTSFVESDTEKKLTLYGYVIYWNKLAGANSNNQTVNSYFVRGISTSYTTINDLEPDSKYIFWMASYNRQFNKPSKFLSSKVEVETPKFVAKLLPSPDAKPQKPERWYRRPEYHLALIVLVLLFILLCLTTGCVWCHAWLAGNKKRKKKEKLNRVKLFELELMNVQPDSIYTASTSNSCQRNGAVQNCSQPLVDTTARKSISEKRLMFSKGASLSRSNASSSSNFFLESANQYLDAKGGPSGCHPSGSKRFRQLLRQDPTFRQLIEKEFHEKCIQTSSHLIVDLPLPTSKPIIIKVKEDNKEQKDNQEIYQTMMVNTSLRHPPQLSNPQLSRRRRSDQGRSLSPTASLNSCSSSKQSSSNSSLTSSSLKISAMAQSPERFAHSPVHFLESMDSEAKEEVLSPPMPPLLEQLILPHTFCSCEQLSCPSTTFRQPYGNVQKANNSSPTSTCKTVSSLPNLQYDSGIVFDYPINGSNTQLTQKHNCPAQLEENKIRTMEKADQQMVFPNQETDVLRKHTCRTTSIPSLYTSCGVPLK